MVKKKSKFWSIMLEERLKYLFLLSTSKFFFYERVIKEYIAKNVGIIHYGGISGNH